MIFVGGTIRRNADGSWATIEDSAHVSTGISHVEVLADRLRLHYSQSMYKIITFHTDGDEVFKASHIEPGPSVGLDYADIFLYKAGSATPISPNSISNQYANIWISGYFQEEVAACPAP